MEGVTKFFLNFLFFLGLFLEFFSFDSQIIVEQSLLWEEEWKKKKESILETDSNTREWYASLTVILELVELFNYLKAPKNMGKIILEPLKTEFGESLDDAKFRKEMTQIFVAMQNMLEEKSNKMDQ